jgi:hypothetical protein
VKELDVSPQAKGPIERVWGTFQDRPASEIRLAGASTIEQANEVLGEFLPRLCFKYINTVAKDNTVRFNGSTMQLMPDEYRASHARAVVEIQ